METRQTINREKKTGLLGFDMDMEQKNRLDWLIRYLIDERKECDNVKISKSYNDKRTLFRALVNVRPPRPASEEFIEIQDAFLSEELQQRGIVGIDNMPPCNADNRIFIWQGDITQLAVDAIVNAANNQMLGCFVPEHRCIDNAIHTYAGIQLRSECAAIMKKQGFPEPTGQAKITLAYNLPSKFILHTVGPIIYDNVSDKDRRLLESCYISCLELADKNKIENIAFCCISTGEFRFPNEVAAEIAAETVSAYLRKSTGIKNVIFNVFKDKDKTIYERLLGA
jgi:O-acetyl-ADP-ribose deacetylase (regulator of RNase III)